MVKQDRQEGGLVVLVAVSWAKSSEAAPAAAFPPAWLPFWVIGEAKVSPILRHSRLLFMKSNDALHELLMNKRLSDKKVPDRLRKLSAQADMLLADGGCV